jgi:hypothetical protein
LVADGFAQGLVNAGVEAGQIKHRLEQGVLPREILESEFKGLIVKVSDNEPIEIAAVAAGRSQGRRQDQGGDPRLRPRAHLRSERLQGERSPVFSIKSKEDCHLTLINVDASGEGTVIFPNKFQHDNFLGAGKEVQFPGPDAPFQFRLKDPGTETVIAICNASGQTADGIKNDFKKRQFTELGNYRGFLTRQIVAEAKDKLAEGQKEKGKAAEAAPAPGPSEILSRTAIKLNVK